MEESAWRRIKERDCRKKPDNWGEKFEVGRGRREVGVRRIIKRQKEGLADERGWIVAKWMR